MEAPVGIGMLCCGGFGGLIGLALTVFWIWMLVDCLMKEPSQGNDKIIWALLIIFIPALGSLLYFLIRRPQRIRDHGE